MHDFDKVADVYDATRGMAPGVDEEICQWIMTRLPEQPAITEIGVGTGRIALPFILRNVRYTGIDVSVPMMDVLRGKLGGDLRRAQLLVGDVAQTWPVAPASQDAVIAVGIFHHVDVVRTLEQVRRALKPGGALISGAEGAVGDSFRQRLRGYYFQALAELFGPSSADVTGNLTQRTLEGWSTPGVRYTVATWERNEAPRATLTALWERQLAGTWGHDETSHREIMRQVEAQALERYGDLDAVSTQTYAFHVDWYQF